MTLDELIDGKVADIEEQVALIESGANVVMMVGGNGQPASKQQTLAFMRARINRLKSFRNRSPEALKALARADLDAYKRNGSVVNMSNLDLLRYVMGARSIEEFIELLEGSE